MKIIVAKDAVGLGEAAALRAAQIINKAIEKKGHARIVLSTGASQFTMFEAISRKDVDWNKVEMFHLDEYVDLPITHPASFRKYLQERFIDIVKPGKVNLVSGNPADIPALTASLRSDVIDLGMIGIGVNGHIAFNDPPADLDTREAFITVNLDEVCRTQQLNEGWFPTLDDVPKQAISMTVFQILRCEKILSCVPYAVKANAVRDALTLRPADYIPAAFLKTKPDWELYVDVDSIALTDETKIIPGDGDSCEIVRL